MDGERNIVQTVLKANNTFKDFSVSLLRSLSTLAHKHAHKPFSLSGKVNEALSRTTTGERRSTREKAGGKRDIRRIYGNEERREALREAAT